MACNLTKGRSIACRDGIGGVKSIYIAQHDEITSYTAASGVVTDFDMSGGHDVYRYILKRTGHLLAMFDITSSDMGTIICSKLVADYMLLYDIIDLTDCGCDCECPDGCDGISSSSVG